MGTMAREAGVWPMGRMIVGTLATCVAYVFVGPEPAIAVGAVFGLWVVIGVASAVHAATDKPTEHLVHVAGVVGHVNADAARTLARPLAPPQLAAGARRREAFIECARCSAYVAPTSDACSCGWQVPTAARARDVAHPREVVPRPSRLTPRPLELAVPAPTAALDGASAKPCPACPRCRAPTAWVAEFERFLCERCDVYV